MLLPLLLIVCVILACVVKVINAKHRRQLEFDKFKQTLLCERKNANNIITVFFQGNGSTRSQAAKYTGKRGVSCYYYDSMNKRITMTSTSSRSPMLLYNVFTCKELSDVYTRLASHSLPLTTVSKLIFYILNLRYIMHPIVDWWFSTDTTSHNGVSQCITVTHCPVTEMNVSGRLDVEQHRRMVKKCMDKHPLKKLVLFGCSRGASTTLISFVQMDKLVQKQIRLVILEAPFDTVSDVVRKRFYTVGGVIVENFLSTFGTYEKDQLTPLESISRFPLNTPVAFIYSKSDTVVPPECTENLINVLKKRGHKKLHTLVFTRGQHQSLSIDDVGNMITYKNFVEKLYDKYCC